ncbi:FAD-dependent oxidoreductase [Deinococcus malanensis]|uniref:FAD-dependent oxidoreductase n=1 Tax=Deinococcus malanensis TaxID=1706855 RepID=UPI0036323CCD
MILATGVRPNVDLSTAAGIPFGPTGAIAVDEQMETSVRGCSRRGIARSTSTGC